MKISHLYLAKMGGLWDLSAIVLRNIHVKSLKILEFTEREREKKIMLDQLLMIILLHKNKLESLLRPCVFHLRKVQRIFLVHRRTNFVRGFK